MQDKYTKYIVVGIIIFLAIFFDQWTKIWAEDHLASTRFPEHVVTRTVDESAPVMTLESYVKETYPNNDAVDQQRIVMSATKDGAPLAPADKVAPGDTIDFGYVSITVIDGYYDYQYARNPGAAWSFLANQPETFRMVFFGITGILAVVLLAVFIYKTAWTKNRLLVITLACVLGGAVGNMIDRFRLGYVIDFISWHVGDKYWPTFNIADVFVTGGVIFLIIDLIIHRNDDKNEAAAAEKAAVADGEADKKEEVKDDNDDEKSDDAEESDDSEKSDKKADDKDVKSTDSDTETPETDKTAPAAAAETP